MYKTSIHHAERSVTAIDFIWHNRPFIIFPSMYGQTTLNANWVSNFASQRLGLLHVCSLKYRH